MRSTMVKTTVNPAWTTFRQGALVVCSLFCLGQTVQADTVTLRNGRQIEGAVISETAAELVVQTRVGQVRVSRREIASITRLSREPEEVQAQRASSQGNYAEAVRLLERLVTRAQTARNNETEKRAQAALDEARAKLKQIVERELQSKLRTARDAFGRNDLDQALSLAKNALPTITGAEAKAETNRFLSQIHIRLAERAADRQDSLGQLRELNAAVEVDPGYYPAQLALGQVLLESVTEEQRGLTLIESALSAGGRTLSDVERARFHYLIGDRYFRKKQYQDAATNFVAVLGVKDAPRELSNALDRAVECYVNLGEAAIGSGSERTLEGLSEALNLNPRNPKALFLMGQILYTRGNFKESVENLQKVLAIDPSYRQANALIAKASMALKDFSAASAAYDAELRLTPDNYEVLCDRAELRLLIADYTGARADIEEAKKKQADGIRAFLLEAQLNIIDEKFDEAQASLNSLMLRATTPKDKLEPYLQMGRVLARKKETEDARKWFQTVADFLLGEAKVIGTTSSLPLRYRNILAEVNVELGKLNLEQDNPRSAEVNFKESLSIVEDYPQALIGIGDVRRRLGDETASQTEKDSLYREAEASYKRALAINQRDADSILKLAILYHRFMKDTKRAREEYKRYIDLGGRDKATAQQGLDEIGQETAATDEASTTTASGDGTTTDTAATTATAVANTTTATTSN